MVARGLRGAIEVQRVDGFRIGQVHRAAAIDDELAEVQLRVLFRKKLAEFAQTLTEREEDILRNRLLSESPVTLEDLGRKYMITKERTRQLEAKIIKKLRELMKKDIQDFEHLRK